MYYVQYSKIHESEYLLRLFEVQKLILNYILNIF